MPVACSRGRAWCRCDENIVAGCVLGSCVVPPHNRRAELLRLGTSLGLRLGFGFAAFAAALASAVLPAEAPESDSAPDWLPPPPAAALSFTFLSYSSFFFNIAGVGFPAGWYLRLGQVSPVH